MRQSGGWKLTGGGQTGVVEHRGRCSELCAGAVGVCQEVEKQQVDLHWIAEPRGSEHSTSVRRGLLLRCASSCHGLAVLIGE